MALKDRIPRDNYKVFMNLDHFGEEHTWNGVTIECVEDDTEALKRKNNNVNDLSWDNDVVDKVIFVPEDSLPSRAQPNEFVIYDGIQMRISSYSQSSGVSSLSAIPYTSYFPSSSVLRLSHAK